MQTDFDFSNTTATGAAFMDSELARIHRLCAAHNAAVDADEITGPRYNWDSMIDHQIKKLIAKYRTYKPEPDKDRTQVEESDFWSESGAEYFALRHLPMVKAWGYKRFNEGKL
ncbi:hypothetical protein OAF54_03385 [bacterium]|nr:hypothetical protein [bacterium]